jgi:hypothetical protein
VEGFAIPVKVWVNREEKWLKPTKGWKAIENLPANSTLKVDSNFYVIPFDLTVK